MLDRIDEVVVLSRGYAEINDVENAAQAASRWVD